jgi:hypothetical protein
LSILFWFHPNIKAVNPKQPIPKAFTTSTPNTKVSHSIHGEVRNFVSIFGCHSPHPFIVVGAVPLSFNSWVQSKEDSESGVIRKDTWKMTNHRDTLSAVPSLFVPSTSCLTQILRETRKQVKCVD